MNTLRQLGRFVNMSPRVSLQTIGNYVTKRGERISTRTVIQRLQNLSPLTLEIEPFKTDGEVPLDALFSVRASKGGVVLESYFRILRKTGEIIYGPSVFWTGDTQVGYQATIPGAYLLEVTRTGITSTGYAKLIKTSPFQARPKAPPPPSKPTIAVQANGDGSFVVNGSGFLPNATVHIRIVDAALTTVWFNHTSSVQGILQFPTGKICQLPGQLFFSANDGRIDSHDLTGTLWSNTVTTTCSA